MERGNAIAIFCFLPWCQVNGGNVLVDFVTSNANPCTNHLLEALGDLIYLLVTALVVWRLFHGGTEMREYGKQTVVLRIPLWWGFPVIIPAMALLVATCAATLVGHLRGLWGDLRVVAGHRRHHGPVRLAANAALELQRALATGSLATGLGLLIPPSVILML